MAAETPSEEEPTAQAEPEQEASAEEPAKPKARRRAKPKADAKSEAEGGEVVANADADLDADAQPEAPKKPRRSRTKKPAAEASGEAQDEAEVQTDGEEQAADDEAAAKPKPRRRSRAAADEETPREPEPRVAPAPARVARSSESVRVVRAQAKYVRTSARKARLVCDHLRGKSVDEARAILAFNPRGVARDWSKVLESAVSNAENNHELLVEDLFVREAFADEGPTIKRFQPRARGRASAIRKRTSHLTITLAPDWRE